jgi:DNA repair protein RadB
VFRKRLLDSQLTSSHAPRERFVDFPVFLGLLARARLDDIEFAGRGFDGTFADLLAVAAGDIHGGEYVAHPARAGAEVGCGSGFIDQFDRDIEVVDNRGPHESRAVTDADYRVRRLVDFVCDDLGSVCERDVKRSNHDLAREHRDARSFAGVHADDCAAAVAQHGERRIDRPPGLVGVGAHEFHVATVEFGFLSLGNDEDTRSFGEVLVGFHSRELDPTVAEFGDDPVIDFEVLGGDDDHARLSAPAAVKRSPRDNRTTFVRWKITTGVSEPISTGCAAIDDFLGGGFPRESVTQVYGPPAAGKTNLALSAAIETAAAGELAYYIDTEGLSIDRFEQLARARSENIENLSSRVVIAEALDFEDQEEAVRDSTDLAERASLVVLDSATGFYRLERTKQEDGEALRRVGRQVTHLLSLARKHDLAVCITNQVFADPESESGRARALGGHTLSHLTGVIVRLERFRAGNRRATLEKHGSKAAGETVRFEITDTGLEGIEDE